MSRITDAVTELAKPIVESVGCTLWDVEYVREWLDYGRLNGIGQWRNSGKGRFVWEELSDG